MKYTKPTTKFIQSPTILSTSIDIPPCSLLSVLLHPLSPALCWCTDFLFTEGKPVCYAGEFQRKGDNPSAVRPSLCYNSADKTTDPYLHAESALHHAQHLPHECHTKCRSLDLMLFRIFWAKLWKLCSQEVVIWSTIKMIRTCKPNSNSWDDIDFKLVFFGVFLLTKIKHWIYRLCCPCTVVYWVYASWLAKLLNNFIYV